MRRAVAQLILLLVALLLCAGNAGGSLTSLPLPDLDLLAKEALATDAGATSQLTDWDTLEPQDAVIAVLILPDDYSYDAPGVVILLPCDPKNRLYRVFRDGQLPLGL